MDALEPDSPDAPSRRFLGFGCLVLVILALILCAAVAPEVFMVMHWASMGTHWASLAPSDSELSDLFAEQPEAFSRITEILNSFTGSRLRMADGWVVIDDLDLMWAEEGWRERYRSKRVNIDEHLRAVGLSLAAHQELALILARLKAEDATIIREDGWVVIDVFFIHGSPVTPSKSIAYANWKSSEVDPEYLPGYFSPADHVTSLGQPNWFIRYWNV